MTTLPPGTRLAGGPGTVYELTGPGWSDDRNTYDRARKVFHNFRHPAESLDEAPADEALDVLIRRPDESGPDPEFECRAVLSLPGMPFFLEPIDLIDRPGATPWLVLADPHAAPMPPADPGVIVPMLTECLGMLDALHRSGLEVGAMVPSDFLADADGRWFFLATDRVRPSSGAGSARDDLAHWARLADGLLGGSGATDDRVDWLSERVRRCLDDPPASVAELARGASSPLARLWKAFRP